MSEWAKLPPNTAGWYWVRGKSFFKPTPIEIRTVTVNQIPYKEDSYLEWWNPKTGEWEKVYGDGYISEWQPVDNVPHK